MEDNFTSLALEFVKEISEVFPEEAIFSECVKNFSSYNPKKFLIDTIGDHQSLVISKDDKLFDLVKIPGLNIKTLWSSVSDTTKESIWAYLSTLVMLATALDNTPKELMSGIETLAQEFSEKMQHGELNMETLFTDVMERVQQMDLSSMKDIDIGSLTKSMGIDPSMISNMMGGSIDPSLIQNMMSMVGGGGDEEDLLKLLETAKPPPRLEAPKKKKKSKGKNYDPLNKKKK
ncbi:hypothetical protein MT325_M485R [Paramecium bursaria chlorella virus MT325]|uniref:Uncharacterized protein M485R n=1 Tax=Paramecium bursaria Chlorella virus MT325 TaxID=346932 RepID=A7IUL5_PBCVM|nr:hypothetical protein MT325_M485R [Paramecium bursaria chlorella virus MT325]